MSSIRPARPTLEGTSEEMLETLLVYTFQLEEYCDVYDEYIEGINAHYTERQVTT